MNYRLQLKNPASIGYIETIVQLLISNPDDFEDFFSLIFDEDTDIAWRAGWVCDKVSRKYPQLFTTEHILRIADALLLLNHHGIRRGYLCLLNNLGLPDEVPVELINKLFDWMIFPKIDVSAQVLSMKLLYKICMKQPDFTQELKVYLENTSPTDYTPGYNATRRRIIKLLNSYTHTNI